MTRRFTEYSAIIVKMPESSAGILNFVVKIPVTTPESIPAKHATRIAGIGDQPATSSEAATAAPRGKLPSTVRSATSSTRKVR